MDFPQFQAPDIGHGMIIGLNAVTHVVLSHGLAIGVFFFIVVTELIGYLRKSEIWDRFAHFAIVPTAVLITGFSAITGVGIWFTIGTLAPRAASEMLRLFFWPWFIESLDFLAEEIYLLLYYLLWMKMRTGWLKVLHIQFGFAYVVGAFISAFLITGIIGFQLTPDRWIWEQNFWNAFFNPSLWPQTFLRFFGGIAIGAIMITGLLFFWRKWENKEELAAFRRSALRLYGGGLIVFSAATYGCFMWYFGNIPDTFRVNYMFAILTSHLSQSPWIFWTAVGLSAAMILLLALSNIIGIRVAAKIFVVPALIGAIVFVAGFERMREFIRGPYVMASYLYTSEWTAKETVLFKNEGMQSRLYWPDAGYGKLTDRQQAQALFGHNCSTCHTIGGLNDIRRRVQGRSADGIAAIINHTKEMVPWMPPFAGNDRERLIMAQYLYEIANQERFVEPSRYPSHEKEYQE